MKISKSKLRKLRDHLDAFSESLQKDFDMMSEKDHDKHQINQDCEWLQSNAESFRDEIDSVLDNI